MTVAISLICICENTTARGPWKLDLFVSGFACYHSLWHWKEREGKKRNTYCLTWQKNMGVCIWSVKHCRDNFGSICFPFFSFLLYFLSLGTVLCLFVCFWRQVDGTVSFLLLVTSVSCSCLWTRVCGTFGLLAFVLWSNWSSCVCYHCALFCSSNLNWLSICFEGISECRTSLLGESNNLDSVIGREATTLMLW